MIRPLLLLALTPMLAAQPLDKLGALSPSNGETPPAAAPAPTPAPATQIEQILQPPEPGRFRNLFQLFRTERAALSPDGRHLAFTVRQDDGLYVMVVDCDQPGTAKAAIKVVDDNGATLRLGIHQREDTPGRIHWLRWATANRVVVSTNEAFQQGSGAVLAFDADGGNARVLATPRDMLPALKIEGGFAIGNAATSPLIGRTPDMDPTEVDAVEATANAVLGLSLPAEDDTAALPVSSLTDVRPGKLQIFDLDPKRPGAVTILFQGSSSQNNTHWLDFQSLDTQTGKITTINNTLVADSETPLLDRQGRQRLTLPANAFNPYPLRYSYYGDTGSNRARPLDSIPGATGFSISPGNFFGERSIPLGFAEDPNLLYFASNVGRDTHGIYSLNLKTGQRGALVMENADWDLVGPPSGAYSGSNALVYDRYSHELVGVRYQADRRTAAWIKPELRTVQAELEKALPGRSVEIVEWDQSGQRFLATSEGPADPGAFHLYDRTKGRLSEFARRAPWVDTNHTYTTLPFGFTLGDGTRLSGFITIPRQPRMNPIPMILLCPDTPWSRATPDYDREVHALAGMGFVVAQLNGRGAWGNGKEQRKAITSGYDLVQVQDLVAAVDALSRRFKINAKRVALMGRGHGGFIALRAVQDYPEKFRCAIAMEPPVNLGEWLTDQKWNEREDIFSHLTRAWLGDEARLKAAPLVSAPEKITKPVLLLSYPRPGDAQLRPLYLAARQFAASVRRHGGSAEFADLHHDYVSGLPAARAEVFDRIEEFLNLNIYDFKVKLQDLKVAQN